MLADSFRFANSNNINKCNLGFFILLVLDMILKGKKLSRLLKVHFNKRRN